MTEPISVNNRRLNLAIALRHIRSRTESRLLFADAICINQEDINECGQQVRLMADISHEAKRVVVWLGPDLHGTVELVCGYIQRYAAHVAEGAGSYQLWEDFMSWDSPPPDQTTIAEMSKMLQLP